MYRYKRAHARIYQCWLVEPAWRALRGHALKLLVHFLARHRPGAEGFTFTDADASTAMSCHPDTARKALSELDQIGFIDISRTGGLVGPKSTRSRYIRLQTYPAGPFLSPPRSRMPFGRIDENWMLLPAWRDLSGFGAKLLADLLARHSEGGENSYQLPLDVIGERVGCSRQSASRIARELCAKGWLQSSYHDTRRAQYSLSQFPTVRRAAEPWRYERWISRTVAAF